VIENIFPKKPFFRRAIKQAFTTTGAVSGINHFSRKMPAASPV
jgi:hypothetical protein